MALGGALTAFGLAAAHYDAHAVTPDAVHMMRLLYYVPAAMTIVAQLICIGFYPERPQQHRTIGAELEGRVEFGANPH